MKRIVIPIAAVLLTLVFLFAAYGLTVSAQDVTEEPPVVTETPEPPAEEPTEPDVPGTEFTSFQIVVIVALAVLGVISAVFGTVIVQMARDAKDTLPRWMVEGIRSGAPGALDALDRLTNVPGDLDDQIRARVRKMVEEILAEAAPTSLKRPPLN